MSLESKKAFKVGIVGATGAVGKEMINVLHQHQFPLDGPVQLFASERSAGKELNTPYGLITIQLFQVEAVQQMDFVFLAVSGSFAKKFAPQIAGKGPAGHGLPIVIDNSSAFRLEPDVPLVIPEINGAHITAGQSLIANPNCSTAIAAMALYPLHCEFGLKKVIMSTYQASSGAGVEGMDELRNGAAAYLQRKPVKNEIFAHPLPFNVIPHIDTFQDNLYTREEMKVTWETQKIFASKDIAVSCTAVRIPTFRAHAESITIETERPINVPHARLILQQAQGVVVTDKPAENLYPMPLTASEKDDVEVGRIRQNLIFGKYGLDFFVCGDQLLRGAALNAVLIAEYMVKPSAFPQICPPTVSKKGPCGAFFTDSQHEFKRGLLAGVVGSTALFLVASLVHHHRH